MPSPGIIIHVRRRRSRITGVVFLTDTGARVHVTIICLPTAEQTMCTPPSLLVITYYRTHVAATTPRTWLPDIRGRARVVCTTRRSETRPLCVHDELVVIIVSKIFEDPINDHCRPAELIGKILSRFRCFPR